MYRFALGLALMGAGCSATPPATPEDGSSSTGPTTEASGSSDSSASTAMPSSTTGLATDADATSGTTSGSSDASVTGGDTDDTGSSESGAQTLDCAMLGTPEGPVEIGASDTPTRIHPFLAFDGEGVWFAHAEVEPAGSLFDVAATRLRCDGSTWVPTQTVSTNIGNDIDPSISVVGDEIHIVWTTDDGSGGSSNLQIFHSELSVDGRNTAAATQLGTVVEGVAVTQNHTAATTTARGTEWIIAGVRAHPQTTTFQAFAQTLDDANENVGEAWDGFEPATSHLAVAVASSASGQVSVTHTRATDDDDDVILTRLGAKLESVAQVEAFSSFATTVQPSIATDPTEDGAGFVAALADIGGELDIVVARYSPLHALSAPLQLGMAGRLDHNPILSVGDGGSVGLVFHRNVGGLNNEVVFVALTFSEDAGLSAGTEQVLASASPPYPPTITSLGGERWMVGWAQGTSPLFTTWARVVEPI